MYKPEKKNEKRKKKPTNTYTQNDDVNKTTKSLEYTHNHTH